jgi:hypothetical protein
MQTALLWILADFDIVLLTSESFSDTNIPTAITEQTLHNLLQGQCGEIIVCT